MVLEVQTDGCTYHKWLSASVSDRAGYTTWHSRSASSSTSFKLCQHNAGQSRRKLDLFRATLQLFSDLWYISSLWSGCPSGLWVGFSLILHLTTHALHQPSIITSYSLFAWYCPHPPPPPDRGHTLSCPLLLQVCRNRCKAFLFSCVPCMHCNVRQTLDAVTTSQSS